ncbi:YpzI family protein, partial [Neobacillus niacini]
MGKDRQEKKLKASRKV